jgi:hypothetical protein
VSELADSQLPPPRSVKEHSSEQVVGILPQLDGMLEHFFTAWPSASQPEHVHTHGIATLFGIAK